MSRKLFRVVKILNLGNSWKAGRKTGHHWLKRTNNALAHGAKPPFRSRLLLWNAMKVIQGMSHENFILEFRTGIAHSAQHTLKIFVKFRHRLRKKRKNCFGLRSLELCTRAIDSSLGNSILLICTNDKFF